MPVIADKLAAQVLQKAFDNSQASQAAPKSGEASSFQQMLDNVDAASVADMLGPAGNNPSALQGNAKAISAEGIPMEGSLENLSHVEPKEGQALMSMLSDFNNQQVHMDHLVNDVLFGAKKFSNQELLAIQAHVFHVAQMTELTVKSVELAVSSFKGVMNTQIQ